MGTVWGAWDFTAAHAARLAAVAVELRLDGATVAALLCRLAAEEEAEKWVSGIAAAAGRPAVPAKQPSFECTLTLLLVWAQGVGFPGHYPAAERGFVLRALAIQVHRPGFRMAAGPVIDAWARLFWAMGAQPATGGASCASPCGVPAQLSAA